KSDKGTPLKDKKVYLHVLVDRLKVLDRGDAEPWAPPRRGRDDAADTAFNTFEPNCCRAPLKT
ncbi:hypothetical protein B0H10DRAFT_2104336, partial [Mycena sp. CBHHK59/15]